MKKIIIIAVIAIAVVLAGALFLNKDNSTWAKVEYQKVKETFTVSGNVKTLKESIFKAPLKGKITRVLFEEGDLVKEGQVIAEYEKDNYDAQMDQLNAELYKAQQNYTKMNTGYRKQDIAKAKSYYENQKLLLKEKELEFERVANDKERNKALFDKKMLTPQEYEKYIKTLEITRVIFDNQKHNVDSAYDDYSKAKEGFRKEDIQVAKANVEYAKAAIKDFQSTYDKTNISSPVSGKITEKDVYPADNVLPGKILFKVYNKEDLEIKALIEEEDISNVRMKDSVKIVLDAFPNSTIKGHVSSIYDKVEESTRLLPIKVTIDENNDKIDILPGMTASCTFGGHEINYLTVPIGALNKDGKKYYVETKNGKVYLEVGKEHDNKVLVKGKLTTSDEVLVK